jgi:hypothetical protein
VGSLAHECMSDLFACLLPLCKLLSMTVRVLYAVIVCNLRSCIADCIAVLHLLLFPCSDTCVRGCAGCVHRRAGLEQATAKLAALAPGLAAAEAALASAAAAAAEATDKRRSAQEAAEAAADAAVHQQAQGELSCLWWRTY